MADFDPTANGAVAFDPAAHGAVAFDPTDHAVPIGDTTVTQQAQNDLTAKADAAVPFQTPPGAYRGSVLPFMTDAQGHTSLAMPEMLAAPLRGVIKGGQAATSQRPAMSLSGDPDLAAAAMGAQLDRAPAAPKAPTAPVVDVTGAPKPSLIKQATDRVLASRLPEDANPESQAASLRVSQLIHEKMAATTPTGGVQPTLRVAANAVKSELNAELQSAGRQLKDGGHITPEQFGEFKVLQDQALRNNNTLGTGPGSLLDTLDNWSVPDALKTALRDKLRELDTVSTQSFQKNETGPLREAGAFVGKVGGVAAELAHGNLMAAAGGAMAAPFTGKLGGALGGVADRALGLNTPKVTLAAQNAARAMRASGIDPAAISPTGRLPLPEPVGPRGSLPGPVTNMEPPSIGGPSLWRAPAEPGVAEPTGVDLMQAMEILERGRKERPFAGSPVQPYSTAGSFTPNAEGIRQTPAPRERPFANSPIRPYADPGAFEPTTEGIRQTPAPRERPFANAPIQPYSTEGSFTPNAEGIRQTPAPRERPFASSPTQPFQPPGSFTPNAEGIRQTPPPTERPFAGSSRKPVPDHGGAVEEPHTDLMAEMEALDKKLKFDPDTGLPRHDPVPVNTPIPGPKAAPQPAPTGGANLPQLRPDTPLSVANTLAAEGPVPQALTPGAKYAIQGGFARDHAHAVEVAQAAVKAGQMTPQEAAQVASGVAPLMPGAAARFRNFAAGSQKAALGIKPETLIDRGSPQALFNARNYQSKASQAAAADPVAANAIHDIAMTAKISDKVALGQKLVSENPALAGRLPDFLFKTGGKD